MTNLFNYIDRRSPIHAMTGASKLVCFLLLSFAAMVTYDTRILLLLLSVSLVCFRISKIRLGEVSAMLWFTIVLALLNNVMVYLFSPEYGCELYASRTLLFPIAGRYTVTLEQLFYHCNLMLKYLTIMPVAVLFASTTDPSEFAASLNRLGVSYKIAYAVSLAMRYIPDIQKEYHEISLAQQARGIELSRKENLFKRLRSASAILIPLILSSMERIDTISDAMELRAFGKNPRRTWYNAREFSRTDVLAMVLCLLLLIAAFVMNAVNGSRFYNPFH